MSDPIKVSVIVPVFNAEDYLEETAGYILDQSLDEIEIIFVDDGSTDSSREIIKRLMAEDPRIILLEQENLFAGTARNKGLEKASGEYLMFWDSDDIFARDALWKMYDKIRTEQADICVCAGNQYDCETDMFYPAPQYLNLNKIPSETETFSRETNEDNILNFTTAVVWNKMLRREFVLKEGLRFQGIRNGNDIFFVVNALCLASKITYVEDVLVTYRKNQKASLVSTSKKAPETPVYAWRDTALELKRRGVFPERSFANKAIDSIAYLLRNLNDYDAFISTVNMIKTDMLEDMGIAGKPVEYFNIEWHGELAQHLANSKDTDILNYIFRKTYTQMQKAQADVKINKTKLDNARAEIKERKYVASELKRLLREEIRAYDRLKRSSDNALERKTRQYENTKHDLEMVKASASFKIGRIVTYLPRKIKSLIRGDKK